MLLQLKQTLWPAQAYAAATQRLLQQSRSGLSALTLVTHAKGAHCPDEVVCGSPLQSRSGAPLALGSTGVP